MRTGDFVEFLDSFVTLMYLDSNLSLTDFYLDEDCGAELVFAFRNYLKWQECGYLQYRKVAEDYFVSAIQPELDFFDHYTRDMFRTNH